MVEYHRTVLPNGLTLLVNSDYTSQLFGVSLVYKAGSGYDLESSTGMAHLLEHIMFEGSIHAPNFDKIMQRAGGENNAYTNPDIAHYYDIIPKSNLESVLWLEADRMANLKLSRHSFRVQKKNST